MQKPVHTVGKELERSPEISDFCESKSLVRIFPRYLL